jgi:hypothetical protein
VSAGAPALDPGYFRLIYTGVAESPKYDVAYYVKESDTWGLAICVPANDADAGSEHGDKEGTDGKADSKDDPAKKNAWSSLPSARI